VSFTPEDVTLLERFDLGLDEAQYPAEKGMLASLLARVKNLVPEPRPLDLNKYFDMRGTGEVIERSDPRHPKYQAPDAPVDQPEPQPT
jgi:hypothetical protein